MASIKYKDNGTYKDIVVKVGDTQPIGTIVDYEGSVVPDGWEEVENVLWENTSPTTAIENGAEFSLSSSDYDYYSIIYNLSTSGTNISFNTEKIPKGQGTVLSMITSGASNFNGLQRNINHTSDTKLTSGVPYSFNNSSRSIDNTVLIPTKIIGYKKQIKKIAPVTPANGNIKNNYGTSQTDTYSQEYINNNNTICHKIWEGTAYQQDDTMVLSEPLEMNKLYIFRFLGNSSWMYNYDYIIYTGQDSNLGQINYYSYPDTTGFRYRMNYNASTQTITISSASNGATNRAIKEIYKVN